MDIRKIGLGIGFVILLCGIAFAFVYLFRADQSLHEYQQQVREERVHQFLADHGKQVRSISFNDVSIREHEILRDGDNNLYSITHIGESASGETQIGYRTTTQEQLSISARELTARSLSNVTQKQQIGLREILLDDVSISVGDIFTHKQEQYTISGAYARAGQLYVTYVADDGEAYAVVLKQVASDEDSDTGAASYTTSSGEQITVSVSDEEKERAITSHTQDVESEITQLEEELSDAEARGDTETAATIEEEIEELETSLVDASETVSNIDNPTTDTSEDETVTSDTTTEATDGEEDEAGTTTDDTETTSTSTDTESSDTTTTDDPQTSDIDTTTDEVTEESDETVTVSPADDTQQVDEADRDAYYDESQNRWDFNWGDDLIQLIP